LRWSFRDAFEPVRGKFRDWRSSFDAIFDRLPVAQGALHQSGQRKPTSHVFDLKDIFVAQEPGRARDLT
jgi:hypothetical protein